MPVRTTPPWCLDTSINLIRQADPSFKTVPTLSFSQFWGLKLFYQFEEEDPAPFDFNNPNNCLTSGNVFLTGTSEESESHPEKLRVDVAIHNSLPPLSTFKKGRIL